MWNIVHCLLVFAAIFIVAIVAVEVWEWVKSDS